METSILTQVHTKGEYNRLGERIRLSPDSISPEDLAMLQTLRLSYKNILSSVFNILVEECRKVDKKMGITTYRVKRIESIISKLQREPKMQLSRMSDVAGCRCILYSNDKVYALKEQLEKRLCVKTVNDYIATPKPNGYKSLHLIVSTFEDTSKTIEIQLRSTSDHNWATLVEISDLVYQTKIKELGHDGDLGEFHRLLSHINEASFSIDTKRKIIDIANRYSYLQKISNIFTKNYIDVRNKWNALKRSNNSFYLISTDSSGSPEIASFRTFDMAEAAYFEKYRDNTNNCNIVLTHIKGASFDTISLAYSNYFLTSNELFFNCYKMMSDLSIDAYNNNRVIEYKNRYKNFLDITIHILGIHLADYLEYRNKIFQIRSIYKRAEWASSIKRHLNMISDTLLQNYRKTPFKWSRLVCSIIKGVLYNDFTKRKINPYKSQGK